MGQLVTIQPENLQQGDVDERVLPDLGDQVVLQAEGGQGREVPAKINLIVPELFFKENNLKKPYYSPQNILLDNLEQVAPEVEVVEVGAKLPAVVLDVVDVVEGERELLERDQSVQPALPDGGDLVAVQQDLLDLAQPVESAVHQNLDREAQPLDLDQLVLVELEDLELAEVVEDPLGEGGQPVPAQPELLQVGEAVQTTLLQELDVVRGEIQNLQPAGVGEAAR